MKRQKFKKTKKEIMYYDFRRMLMPGDVILVRTKSLLGFCIRVIDNAPYNHAEVAVNVGVWKVVGAVARGIRVSGMCKELKGLSVCVKRTKNRVVIPGNGVDDRLVWKSKLFSYLGTPYDVSSLVFWQFLKQLFRKWYGRSGSYAARKLYCSEFAAKVNGLDKWWKLSPGDLYGHKKLKTVFEGRIK